MGQGGGLGEASCREPRLQILGARESKTSGFVSEDQRLLQSLDSGGPSKTSRSLIRNG